MKKKTARRFLARNQWQIAKQKVDKWPSKSFKKHVQFCIKVLQKSW